MYSEPFLPVHLVIVFVPSQFVSAMVEEPTVLGK
jgi:hypothetical protein